MSVWAGWQKQLLAVATLPDTQDNRDFLTDWHSHAETNCRNNPVDISRPISGSTRCKGLSLVGQFAQNYASHDQAAGQFRAQLRSGQYPHLLAALMTGHPYNVSDKVAVQVDQDLGHWGSVTFDNYYANQTFASGSGGIRAPHLLKGWHDLRRSTNQHMPKSLRRSQRNINQAMRALSRGRKVKM